MRRWLVCFRKAGFCDSYLELSLGFFFSPFSFLHLPYLYLYFFLHPPSLLLHYRLALPPHLLPSFSYYLLRVSFAFTRSFPPFLFDIDDFPFGRWSWSLSFSPILFISLTPLPSLFPPLPPLFSLLSSLSLFCLILSPICLRLSTTYSRIPLSWIVLPSGFAFLHTDYIPFLFTTFFSLVVYFL